MDSTLACLAAWLPRQRWYAAKGRKPGLRLVSWWDLPADMGVRVRTYLVADEGMLPAVLYQIPVVARATETVDADPDHIVGSPEPGTTLVDGPFDPAYTRALFDLVNRGGTGHGPRTIATAHPAVTTPVPAAPPVPAAHAAPAAPPAGSPAARVLSAEQSNTSVVFESPDVSVICKVYRQLGAGHNPDIELQTALARAGSPHVARPIGWVEGTWPDLTTAQGAVSGSLAFAQEYLPGVEDAWRVALDAAARGADFREPARSLGSATADVHRTLADCFPARAATAADHETTAATWERRLSIAIAEVPAIAERRDAVSAVYRHALEVEWPPLQRIHGDYHLGQVLRVPGRGWVLLDFEGEPLRPMTERTGPDLALRDVAGMLRSFDYVAGSLRLDHPERSPESVRRWSRDARRAFIAGYTATRGADLDPRHPLLAALELDKAMYEAIYESRHRPTWVAIPLSAVARILERATAVA